MQRFSENLVIVAYLGALSWGIVAHAVKFGATAHPAMYFIVWDMFCGWGAYEQRNEIIAEGESGQYYRVAPAPWGEIKPFGHVGRRHYDQFGILLPRLVTNTLRNSDHEPIARVYIVEELWPKQLNLPDQLYEARYGKPREFYSYHHLRAVTDGQGRSIEWNDSWYDQQVALSIADNPRLKQDAWRGRPFYDVRLRQHDTAAGAAVPSGGGSTLGN